MMSSAWLDSPVVWAPGLARLAISFCPTGSATAAMTMGVEAIAICAARVDGVQVVTTASSFMVASSRANSGVSSLRPSA